MQFLGFREQRKYTPHGYFLFHTPTNVPCSLAVIIHDVMYSYGTYTQTKRACRQIGLAVTVEVRPTEFDLTKSLVLSSFDFTLSTARFFEIVVEESPLKLTYVKATGRTVDPTALATMAYYDVAAPCLQLLLKTTMFGGFNGQTSVVVGWLVCRRCHLPCPKHGSRICAILRQTKSLPIDIHTTIIKRNRWRVRCTQIQKIQ